MHNHRTLSSTRATIMYTFALVLAYVIFKESSHDFWNVGNTVFDDETVQVVQPQVEETRTSMVKDKDVEGDEKTSRTTTVNDRITTASPSSVQIVASSTVPTRKQADTKRPTHKEKQVLVQTPPTTTTIGMSIQVKGDDRKVFQYAQKCLLDSSFAPKSLPAVLTDPSFLPAVDLETHYQELLTASAQFRNIKESKYAGYSGPWIETFWIRTFCCNRSVAEFGGLVPLFLQWNDVSRHTNEEWYSSPAFKNFTKLLRTDVLYVSLSQSDTGLSPRWDRGFAGRDTWNILSLSGGGYGHVPIPLMIKPQPLRPAPLPNAPYLFSFTGSVHRWSSIRKEMMEVMNKAAQQYGTFNATQYSGRDWIAIKDRSLLNLAPRGWGRSSFQLYEIIQMGLVPVYLHNDYEWIPYRGTNASITEFGFAVHIRNFSTLVDTIALGLQKDPNYLRMDERRAKILALRDTHYTFEGTMKQIEYFFQGRGDLRCIRHPIHSHVHPDPGM